MVETPDRIAADPVANNRDSVTPIPPPIEAVPRFSDVLRSGLTMGVISSLVCWLLYGIASLFGTDFDVRIPGLAGLQHVAWYQVLILPVTASLVFALVASALRRRPHCRRTTLLLGYALGALSLLPLLVQPSAVTWPTKIWLAVLHIVTIVLVVPQVARVVGDSDPAVTAGHRRQGLDAS